VFLNNRHYDPSVGVFVSVDPLVTMTGEPYIYGAANPVTYSDPTGLCAGTEVFDRCILNDGQVLDQNTSRTRTPAEADFANNRDEGGAVGDFVFGFVWSPFSMMAIVPAFIDDPVGTTKNTFNPVNWVKGVFDCFSSAEAAGGCAGTAVITGSALRPSPGGRCRSFSGDTEVLMADGTSKRIDLLQVGEMVVAFDPVSGERGQRAVTDVWFHDDVLVDLIIEGHRLTTTEDHKMWNVSDQEWQQAQHIDAGEEVLTSDGELLAVDGLAWSSARTGTAYNLTVDQIHTYFVVVDDDSVLVHNCGRGGAGPVRQGEAGVQRTVDDLEAAGGRVLGREVTVEAGGVRTRPDLFVELPCGTMCFIEVKTGPRARLTPNQSTGFPVIRAGGAVPRGANAAGAGLVPGVPMGPTRVWTVHQSWPL